MFPSFLVSAVKLYPFLFSFPPIQISPLVFWKGGYIHCYCMISQSLSSQPLKRRRADQSWVIPAVSPTLGRTWAGPATRTLPPFSETGAHSSCFVVQLKQFYIGSTDFQATSEAHTRPTRLCELTWEYLSWLRPLKINKRTEALSLVKWWDFRGGGKKTVT